MDFLARVVLSIAGLLVAVVVARSVRAAILILVTVALAGLQMLLARSVKIVVVRYWPALFFAGGIYVLQIFSHSANIRVCIQILFIYSCVWWMGRLVTAGHIPIPSAKPVFRLYLFAHFVRHFTEILGAETRRMLVARRMSAHRLYSHTGLTSLVHSLAAIFHRSLTRAERFYAAQWLRGLDH